MNFNVDGFNPFLMSQYQQGLQSTNQNNQNNSGEIVTNRSSGTDSFERSSGSASANEEADIDYAYLESFFNSLISILKQLGFIRKSAHVYNPYSQKVPAVKVFENANGYKSERVLNSNGSIKEETISKNNTIISKTSWTYNSDGTTTSVKDIYNDGSVQKTIITEYDSSGARTKETIEGGYSEFNFPNYGDLDTRDNFSGTNEYSFLKTTNFGGSISETKFNSDSLPVSKTTYYPDGSATVCEYWNMTSETIEKKYDNEGNIKSVTIGNYTFNYDSKGNVNGAVLNSLSDNSETLDAEAAQAKLDDIVTQMKNSFENNSFPSLASITGSEDPFSSYIFPDIISPSIDSDFSLTDSSANVTLSASEDSSSAVTGDSSTQDTEPAADSAAQTRTTSAGSGISSRRNIIPVSSNSSSSVNRIRPDITGSNSDNDRMNFWDIILANLNNWLRN